MVLKSLAIMNKSAKIFKQAKASLKCNKLVAWQKGARMSSHSLLCRTRMHIWLEQVLEMSAYWHLTARFSLERSLKDDRLGGK